MKFDQRSSPAAGKHRGLPHVLRIAAIALALVAGAAGVHVAAQPSEQVIRVAVKKFDYSPSEIRLKKGVPVVLEFTNDGVMMGFNAPDLGTRADLPPGKVTRVRIVPSKVGTFAFFCDIFCGTGHEDMTGTITVVE